MPSLIEVTERGPDYAMGASGTLFVAAFRNTPDLRMLEAIDRNEGALVERVRVPIRSLFVIREIAITAPPDAAFRAKSSYLMDKYSPHLVATAQVIEGDGLRASIMRGFVTGVTLMSRHKVPTKAFGTALAALDWLFDQGARDPALAGQAPALAEEIAALLPARSG